MRIILTIFIVLITSAVGALAFMLTSPEHREKFFPTVVDLKLQNPFPDLNPLNVKSIEVTNAEGVKGSFHFDSENSQWISTAPWQDRAENMVHIINFASSTLIQEVIPYEDATPEQLGFPEGTHTILIKDTSGKEVAHFQIGSLTSWHASYPDLEELYPCLYLRDMTKGEKAPTYLCIDPQRVTRDLFSNGLTRLRDYRPVSPYAINVLTKVRINNQDASIELERAYKNPNGQLLPAKSDQWRIKKPLELRTDKKSVLGLIDNLAFIKAEEILNPADVTLPSNSTNLLTVDLYYLYREDPVTLTIYPDTIKNNLVYATVSDRPNAIFQIPQAPIASNTLTYTTLPKNVNDLRAKNLLDLNFEVINSAIVIPKGASPVKLSKQKYWKMVAASGSRNNINPDARDDLFHSLMQNSIQKFISDAPGDLSKYELDDPFLQVGFTDKYNNVQIIAFGKSIEFEVNGVKQIGYYAYSKGQDSVWLISSSVVSRIRTQAWEWRPLSITGISISTLTHIARKNVEKPKQFLKYDFSTEALVVREGDDPIETNNPIITHEIDGNRAAYFITQVCNLTGARRINPKSHIALKALQKPIITLEIGYEDFDTGFPKQKTLTIAPAGPLKTTRFFYVLEEETGDIFSINRKTYSDIEATLRYLR